MHILNFEEPVTFVADEHPIVNDEDYCEVITTPPRIEWNINGSGNYMMCGDAGDSKEDLIERVKDTVLFEKFFYDEAEGKDFSDYGLEAPTVYDHEECDYSAVKNIGNYINNCDYDDRYSDIKSELLKIAKQKIRIIVT